jgi:DNA primase
MQIEFKKAKLVPIASVLRMRGIELRQTGDYLVGKCPLPFHTSGTHGTFKVNTSNNWWTCFSESCRAKLGKSGGDVIDLICALDNLKPGDAAKWLDEVFHVGSQPQPQIPEPHVETVRRVNKPLTWKLQGVNPRHEMIQSRGISVETAAEWGVGYYRSKQGTASMDDRIVFPLYEDGNLVGYAGRTVLPVTDDNPKWKIGKGVYKTFLYGLERCDVTKPVIVTESCWAPLWFAERGQQAAALMGYDLTEEQESRLEPFETVILALDNDQKGKEKMAKIIDHLHIKHKVVRASLKE